MSDPTIAAAKVRCLVRGVRSRSTIGELEVEVVVGRAGTERFRLPIETPEAMQELGAQIDRRVTVRVEIREGWDDE